MVDCYSYSANKLNKMLQLLSVTHLLDVMYAVMQSPKFPVIWSTVTMPSWMDRSAPTTIGEECSIQRILSLRQTFSQHSLLNISYCCRAGRVLSGTTEIVGNCSNNVARYGTKLCHTYRQLHRSNWLKTLWVQYEKKVLTNKMKWEFRIQV
jgi:hypothetical protein